jgi:putative toxin-antitoxin system antitoxin component (TIGR02293 family)
MEDEGEILKLMQLSVRTYQRRKKDRKPLDPVESDRLYRLAKIQSKAVEVFQDKEVAVDWLKRPNRALGDIPLQLLDTEAGADMVERVLTRIEHGVYS